MRTSCAARLELTALPGIPVVQPGDDLAAHVSAALARAEIRLRDGDVLAVTSKIISRAEGRFVDLSTVAPSERAERVARETGKDPRLVELILREAPVVSRAAPNVLVVRHRLGFVSANAGIDLSNAQPRPSNARPRGAAADSGPWALLLPTAPDTAAESLRATLSAGAGGAAIGVVITDSHGRPFRLGTVGVAIGVAGLPSLSDRRGENDLFGRTLTETITALADQIAAAADLVAGQAAEGRPVIHLRGLSFSAGAHAATELYRPIEQDLYK